MLGARHIVPLPASPNQPSRPRPAPPEAHSSPIVPGACARWARTEGIGFGDLAVLMVADPLVSAALRQGLAWVGARTRDVDPATGAHELALALSNAAVAIVDTALAPDYARALGQLERLPPVWWNGPGADFARIDDALAEHADPAMC
ncbi:AMP-dependent synthetase [Methylobacterium sp. J-076]|uniref:AMP-dependent synthetase n=1 Tax=Methylobacterium sp. J-076 TaxID=2836655 RepID=UPI001FBB2105|nr:AMP-dependent synthetase [Methylobacterium sp. J-076]MCJ2013745.1 AMP-dependent synthetase [Methylobacterium sp. J-076]